MRCLGSLRRDKLGSSRGAGVVARRSVRVFGRPGVGGSELEAMWRRGPFLKISPGCYVARLVADEVGIRIACAPAPCQR